jgi:hypothetical protein
MDDFVRVTQLWPNNRHHHDGAVSSSAEGPRAELPQPFSTNSQVGVNDDPVVVLVVIAVVVVVEYL